MWGPTALLMGKLDFFLHLSDSRRFLCNLPLAHQAADLVSVSGVKGIEGNHPWRLQRHDLPPTPISHTVQFLWQTTSRRGRREGGQLVQCIIASLVSQPATLTHVKQVLVLVLNAQLHKNLR